MAKQNMTSKAQEFRAMSDEELESKVYDLRRDTFALKNAVSSSNKDVKPYQIQQKRRDVARILTIQSERQRKQ
jgi:ribosomal protein L29